MLDQLIDRYYYLNKANIKLTNPLCTLCLCGETISQI
jgi:hypothetical protein